MTGTLTILHPIDLIVPAGEVVAITGASGSGKSTLLGLIAGLDAPTTGSISIDGIDITALDEDGLAKAAREPHRLRLSVLPSAAVADRAREHPCADGDCRVPRARPRALPLLDEVGLPTAATTIRRSSREASSSASRSRARLPTILPSFSPTNRPAISTPRTGRQIIDLLLGVHPIPADDALLVTHDPELASVAHMSVALRDGRVVSQTQSARVQLPAVSS